MGESLWLLRNRMRETFTSGSVGRALGNQCLYPERISVTGSTFVLQDECHQHCILEYKQNSWFH